MLGRGGDELIIREGASRKDDTMPKRLLSESVKDGVGDEMHGPFDKKCLDRLITEYYEERGWNPQEGTLSRDRLAELTQ